MACPKTLSSSRLIERPCARRQIHCTQNQVACQHVINLASPSDLLLSSISPCDSLGSKCGQYVARAIMPSAVRTTRSRDSGRKGLAAEEVSKAIPPMTTYQLCTSVQKASAASLSLLAGHSPVGGGGRSSASHKKKTLVVCQPRRSHWARRTLLHQDAID